MLNEFNSDIEKGNMYLSKRLNDKGAVYFPAIMGTHILEQLSPPLAVHAFIGNVN